MANFSKAFNFRGGFQVDTDVLVVRGPGVGIGSTQPTANLDVANLARFNNQVTVGYGTFNNLRATGIITGDYTDAAGIVSISNGVITSRTPGEVVTYFGDGVNLLNLPTSQWIDIDPGLGFTSIYAQGPVGVSTNDPRFDFQVGGPPFGFRGSPINQNGVGINSAGNIFATGIVSVTGTTGFAGTGTQLRALNASELTVGAIPSNAYDTLIITTEVQADRFTGTADFADDLSLDAETQFAVGIANTLSALNRFLSPTGKIQLGSDDIDEDAADIEITRSSGSTILSRSTAGNARIFAGLERPNGAGVGANFGYGGLVFGSGDTLLPINGPSDLGLANYDIGNVNYYLNAGNQTPFDGQFRWFNDQSLIATLNNDGQLTLFGTVEPVLNCLGVATFRDAFVEDDLTVGNDINITNDINLDGDLNVEGSINIDTLSVGAAEFSGNVTVGNDAIVLQIDGSSTFIGEATISGVNVLNNSGITIGIGGALDTPTAEIDVLTVGSLSNIDPTSTITFLGLNVNSTNVQIDDLEILTSLDVSGSTNFGQLDATNITATGVIDSDSITSNFITVNDNLTAEIIFAEAVTGSSANISGICTFGEVEASTLEIESIDGLNNQPVNFPDGIETVGVVSATDITATNNINVGNLLLTQGEIGVGIQTVPGGAIAQPTIPLNPSEPPGPNNPLVFTEMTMSISIDVEDNTDPLNTTVLNLNFNQLGTNDPVGVATFQFRVAVPG